jgi:hypothetical protein
LAELRAAFARLPDFRADPSAAAAIIETAPGVMVEMDEAAALDTDVRLAGQGVMPPFGVDSTNLFDTHQNLCDRAGTSASTMLSWDTGDFVSWYTPIIGDSEKSTNSSSRGSRTTAR